MIKRILIAEDDYTSREALTKLDESAGYDVIAVADGIELLSILNAFKVDLIITDLMMPDLNGDSATEIMKLKGDKTPIIAITGLSDHDIGHIKDKFTGIYHKPINITELFGYIKTLL